MFSEYSASGRSISFPLSFGKYEYVKTIARTNFGIVIEVISSSASQKRNEDNFINTSSNPNKTSMKKGVSEPQTIKDKRRACQHFACKIVIRELLEGNNSLMHFEQETRVQYFLNHPNIVKCYETLYYPEYIVIVQELCKYGDLIKYLQTGAGISFSQTFEMMYQVLLAIDYIHSKNIAHRDLKPDNIYLSDEMKVKVGDFGCCEIMSNTLSEKKEYDSIGSLYYAAPEIILGEIVDPKKTDIWAYGIIVFALFTKNLPFVAENDKEVRENIVNGKLSIPEYLPNGISSLIRRCTKIDPNERPTADELLKNEIFRNFEALYRIRHSNDCKSNSISFATNQTHINNRSGKQSESLIDKMIFDKKLKETAISHSIGCLTPQQKKHLVRPIVKKTSRCPSKIFAVTKSENYLEMPSSNLVNR